MKMYVHPGCSTCKKALSFLSEKKIDVEIIDIREHPPTVEELSKALMQYDRDIKRLFNTSGQSYREKNIKELLPTLTEEERIAKLAEDGMLVKRPFFIYKNKIRLGFKEKEWEDIG